MKLTGGRPIPPFCSAKFQFCSEVVYPTDNDFIYFRIFRFLKYLLSTFLLIRGQPKETICIPKLLIEDGYIFLQHWATCWCRRTSVEQAIGAAGDHPDHRVPGPILRAAAIDVAMWLL